MSIDLDKYERWAGKAEAAGLGFLVPAPFKDQESQRFAVAGRDTVAGLKAGTALIEQVRQRMAGAGDEGQDDVKFLGLEADKLLRHLPQAARPMLEALRPITESLAGPITHRRREAEGAQVAEALTQQRAVMRQLARIGAPLSALASAAKGQLDQLHTAGLLVGDRQPLEQSWLEELAANRVDGRLSRLGDAPLGDQPEAAYLSSESLMHLENRQRQLRTERQEQQFGRELASAVSTLDAGGQPTPEQTALLEPTLPGWSEAAGHTVEDWQRQQDAIAALAEGNPILKRLKTLAGGSGLYRRLLVEQQRRAGLPDEQIKVWDKAESDAAVAAWSRVSDLDEAPPHVRARAMMDVARQHLGSLPEGFAPFGIQELQRRGMSDADAALLRQIASNLEAGRDIAAFNLAKRGAPTADELFSRDVAPPANMSVPEKATPPADPFARAESELALFRAMGRATPEDLPALEAEIDRVLADDPQRAIRWKQKLGEIATAEGLARAGLEHEFSLWAREEGFFATEAVITAGKAAVAASYEVAETARGQIALTLPGDDEPFVELDARLLANLSLDDDEGRLRFQLHLDVLSGRISREEAVAIALKLDPPGTFYIGDEFGERAPLEHPSQTAELIAEAYDALDEGVDPAQVAAFLGLGLFPPSTVSSAVDLAIAFSPIGLIQDAADFEMARRDLAEAEAVGDTAAIDDAQNRMIVAVIGLTPAGKAGDAAKALFKGAKAAAKDGIRALRSSDDLVEKSFEQSANAFKRRYGFKLDQLIGPKWRKLRKKTQRSIRGSAAEAYGELAEQMARVPATERLQREGYEVFDREMELVYDGVNFRIDVVGIKKDAVPAAAASSETIFVEGKFYNLTDVSLVDIKFASAGWSKKQKLVAKPLSEHLRVESPRIDELPAQKMVDIINGIDHLKIRGISITRTQYDKLIQDLPSGTRLHDFILPLLTALLFQWELMNAVEEKDVQTNTSPNYL